MYTIKNKIEVFGCITDDVNKFESLIGKRVKRIRYENIKGHLNHNISNFIKNEGIFLGPCPPYLHELTGTAKRSNRKTINTARCLFDKATIN